MNGAEIATVNDFNFGLASDYGKPKVPPGFAPFTDAASYLVAADFWEECGEMEEAKACRQEAPWARSRQIGGPIEVGMRFDFTQPQIRRIIHEGIS